MPKKNTITIDVETTGLDKAIEKANQLKTLLAEVKVLIDSLKDSSEVKSIGNIYITNTDANDLVVESDNIVKADRDARRCR